MNLIRCQERNEGPEGRATRHDQRHRGAICIQLSVYCNCPYKLVSIGLGYWDQNPGIHTRPDIPLTAIPLNRKRNGITDPGSGMQNRPCAANVWSPRPRVVTTSAGPRRAPMVGSFPLLPRLTGSHAQSTPTPLRNLALRSCPFPDTSQMASGCFHSVPELTPSSIAACESQVNIEMHAFPTFRAR